MANSKKRYVLKSSTSRYCGFDEDGDPYEATTLAEAKHFPSVREAYQCWEEDWSDFDDLKVVPVRTKAAVDVKAAMIKAVEEFYRRWDSCGTTTTEQDAALLIADIKAGRFTP